MKHRQSKTKTKKTKKANLHPLSRSRGSSDSDGSFPSIYEWCKGCITGLYIHPYNAFGRRPSYDVVVRRRCICKQYRSDGVPIVGPGILRQGSNPSLSLQDLDHFIIHRRPISRQLAFWQEGSDYIIGFNIYLHHPTWMLAWAGIKTSDGTVLD